MRSASIQFGWFTREEAARMLANAATTGDSVGDRIALRRRAYPPPPPPPLDDWSELQ